jgi:hypothetical protein
VSGSFLVAVIQVGQAEPELSPSSRPKTEPSFVAGLAVRAKVSLDSPTFFIANFVVKLANILKLAMYGGFCK